MINTSGVNDFQKNWGGMPLKKNQNNPSAKLKSAQYRDNLS